MTALQQDSSAARGDREAIAARVMAQSRHIISTTVTTFGGFLPLILEGSGVLLWTFVSFYFVPSAFYLLARTGRLPVQNALMPAMHPQIAEN
jgi:hypothetical protein